MNYGLWYPKGRDFILISNLDVDWVGCVNDKKSNSRGVFYLNDRLVAWHSKKQESISLSIVEAKYIIAASCCTQVFWIKKTLKDLGINFSEPISVECDNTNVINIWNNLMI